MYVCVRNGIKLAVANPTIISHTEPYMVLVHVVESTWRRCLCRIILGMSQRMLNYGLAR